MAWQPNNGGEKDDIKFVMLKGKETLMGVFKEQKEAKKKDGTPTRWYVFDVDGVKTVISSNAGTLKSKMENCPEGITLRISVGNANGKNYYNVEVM